MKKYLNNYYKENKYDLLEKYKEKYESNKEEINEKRRDRYNTDLYILHIFYIFSYIIYLVLTTSLLNEIIVNQYSFLIYK